MSILNKMHTQEYVYDFDVDGGAAGEIVLSTKANKKAIPVGAVITAVRSKVVTAFTSGGSATLIYGNTDDADGYSGAVIAVAGLTDNSVRNGWDNAAALLWDDTNNHMLEVAVLDADDGLVSVTIATADMTAGKMVIIVSYLMPSEA